MSDKGEAKMAQKVETSSDHAKATLQEALAIWMSEYIRNSPISQFSEAWNHLNGTLPKLVEVFEKKFSE